MTLPNHTSTHAFVSSNNTGTRHKLPVIFVEGMGLLKDHLNYLITNISKGKTWKTNSVQSVRMFMDFISVNQDRYDSATEAFKGFVEACKYGTKDPQGNDPSGLYWDGLSSKRANIIIKHLIAYTDYLANTKDNKELRLNPYRRATRYEQIIELAAYYHRKKNMFLAHLKDDTKETSDFNLTRMISLKSGAGIDSVVVKTFPSEYVSNLLLEGFKKKGVLPTSPIYQRIDLGNVLITYLLKYGGLRVSEPFHIYLDDIMTDEDGCAIIKVYHPSEGQAPYIKGKEKKQARKTYLAKNFGLRPRTDNSNPKSYFSGWKNPALLPGGYFHVNWFPRSAGIEFYKLFKIYIENVRLKQTTYINGDGKLELKEKAKHPFVFVNRDGAPKSYSKYIEQFARAVKKIGLVPQKDMGTTPHGLRHSFAQSLQDNGVDGDVITKALHHRNHNSKDVYTEADQNTVQKALRDGSRTMIRNFNDA